jgi:Uma2 family endonuclease
MRYAAGQPSRVGAESTTITISHSVFVQRAAVAPLRFLMDDGIVVHVVGGVDVTPGPKLMTVAEYFNTPVTVLPTELRFGVLRAADAPTPRHQSMVAALYRALDRHVRTHRLGRVWFAPVDVILDAERALIVQPDLMFISNERASIVRDRVCGAPDLVIEVLSPEPRVGRTDERIQWFAQYHVRECWLVHQERREVAVIEFANGRVSERRTCLAREPIRSAILPDFSETLHDLLESEIT